jgi:hypothetical protein
VTLYDVKPVAGSPLDAFFKTIAVGAVAVLAMLYVFTKCTASTDVAAAGTAVADGSLQFQVTATYCGQIPSPPSTTLPSPAAAATPTTIDPTAPARYYPTRPTQGQWCRAALKVKNIGAGQASFFTGFQKGHAGSYSYDAESYGGLPVALKPGFETASDLYFEVPADVSIDRLELHDWPASGGILVAVTPSHQDDVTRP